ncbi:MAG TPA: GxxExxY protein [Phnomibacter sp.]|nr:GxxExxY protein [Phnomibacter sp.]
MLKHQELTSIIINCFYQVYNKLGYGFAEKVYQHAMVFELMRHGLKVEAQYPVRVHYDGHLVGEFFADILVEEKVVLEIKAVKAIMPEHEAQLFNYLKASNVEVGLLFNFGPEACFIRRVFDNGSEA